MPDKNSILNNPCEEPRIRYDPKGGPLQLVVEVTGVKENRTEKKMGGCQRNQRKH